MAQNKKRDGKVLSIVSGIIFGVAGLITLLNSFTCKDLGPLYFWIGIILFGIGYLNFSVASKN